ncbi:MAG: WYL domain-containing protein [Clostridiales bacterium]|nr:WYL domain-containing protein [Clostridiales bacterium]
MSKVANMLKMIKILKDEKIHNMKDIAEKIEISPRMVKQYKNELEQAGIYIESKRGINGGYSLNKELNNIDIGLTYQELIKLKEIEQYFNENQDFKKIIGKIIESYEKNINEADLKKINRIQELGKSNLKDIYLSLRKAINKKNKVKIKYYSNDSGLNDRVIHPAEMFYYLEEWYVAAFCEKRKAIRLFKLNDIQEYEILDDKYENFEFKK